MVGCHAPLKSPNLSLVSFEQCSVHPGGLFHTEDYTIPTYMGIGISQCKDPYEPISIQGV